MRSSPDRFIERITQFAQERPAYLSLLAAPIRFRRDPAARKASRIAIAKCAFRQRIRRSPKGTVSTCCKRISPDSQRHDDALWGSRSQSESPGGG